VAIQKIQLYQSEVYVTVAEEIVPEFLMMLQRWWTHRTFRWMFYGSGSGWLALKISNYVARGGDQADRCLLKWVFE
jgi:hypothetical protein